ncbi:Non-canonical non-ribosomal peptide synthetase FUB8 [Lachnellula suecica]|uniref:Non-canonical non-ribosomal peptide synthetase FUB8 n=1 Tax=Lachnellula suecica TaxID=602035 RepID=A0A8T9C683_9HELO|nr:Non-canonical non-ribosomal peptide synthetase FUB8 [Lachnellula suecica]
MKENYGSRLMPSILRNEAEINPKRKFAIIARSDNIEDGFVEVTFEQITRAVNFVSHWLRAKFEDGRDPPRHSTITYVGVPDLRYNILFYAALQCRYKVFLPSPRNTTAANVSLLQQTQCSRLVNSIEVGLVAKNLQTALPDLLCEEFLSLEELLAVPAREFIYDLKYEDVYREPVLILHSSGSTGQPKPVVHTHGTFATYDVRDWPTVAGRINHDGLTTLRFAETDSCIYDVFPPFHIAGFLTKVMVPLYNLTAPIFGPPLRPPSGALAAEMIRLHKPRGAVIPPSITEQLYHEHDGADLFKTLDVLLYAGGPLPQVVGDEISKYTTLCQFYGSTEMSQIRQLVPLPEDWSYIEFHPNERFQLQLVEEDMFELVVFADKESERTSSLYHNYPEVREWRTKDLFKRHPHKPNLWKFHARRDDILVFSSGEKLNPIPMETSITALPGVSGALVVGQGHPQASLLVELSPSTQASSDPPPELWPAIEKSNSLLPAHGRIAKTMILIADSKKPFVRAGKGTVVRRLTEELYAAEILKLYTATSTKKRAPISFSPSSFRTEDIKGLIRSLLSEVSVDHQLGDNENFYVHGLDSVKTTEVAGHLKDSLLAYKPESELTWISGETLYRNPTIEQLSSVTLAFLNDGIIPKKRDRVAEMKAKIADYVSDLPNALETSQTKKTSETFSIAITGTTGYFGGYLLAEFANSPRISRIYCLNRSPTARQLFEKQHPQNTADIVFLQVNLALPDLGLNKEDYNKLLQDCAVIVHNAWRVDFNLTLPSFEDNLCSIKHLINLSAKSTLRPRIVFISSISSTGVSARVGSPQQTIPEHIVEDLSMTMEMGYAESKHVSEHILAQSNVPATIIRMGQLSPSSTARTWPEDDSVPVFLKTCKALKLLASDFVDTVDWVQVDQAAAVVNDIVQSEVRSERTQNLRFYNVVNPQAQPWTALVELLSTWCGEGTEVVNMQQWVQRLRELEWSDPAVIDKFPALRMLGMYDMSSKRGLAHKYSMDGLMNASKSMANVTAVDPETMSTWLQRL